MALSPISIRIAEIQAILHECTVNFRNPIFDVRHPLHNKTLHAVRCLEQELEQLQLKQCIDRHWDWLMPKQHKAASRLNLELMRKLYYKDVKKYYRYLVRRGLSYNQRAELLDRLIIMEFKLIK